MKLQEIPFEINNQSLRYLSELVDFCDNFPTDEKEVVYTVETYTGKEKPTYRSEENNARFWEYLKDTKLATYEKPKRFVAVEYEDVGGVPLMYPKTLVVKILESESIKQLAEAAKQDNAMGSSQSQVDYKNGILSYKNTRYKIQNRDGQHILREAFDVLWPDRKIVISGRIKKKGKLWKDGLLGNKIDLAFDRSSNGYNAPSLKNLLKRLGEAEDNIRKKKIPIRITRRGGIQIVLEYKQ